MADGQMSVLPDAGQRERGVLLVLPLDGDVVESRAEVDGREDVGALLSDAGEDLVDAGYRNQATGNSPCEEVEKYSCRRSILGQRFLIAVHGERRRSPNRCTMLTHHLSG